MVIFSHVDYEIEDSCDEDDSGEKGWACAITIMPITCAGL